MINWLSKISPGRVAETDTYDGAAHQVVECSNQDLLLIYTQNDAHHHSPDGRIAVRRSEDYGHSWSEPTAIHDPTGRDATSPSVIRVSGTDRIVVFDFSFELSEPETMKHPPERSDFDTCLIDSADGGETWADPVSVTDSLQGKWGRPFGGAVETKHGLLTAFYSDEWDIEVLVSKDGSYWGNSHIAAECPTGRELAEPVPWTLDDERVMVVGRDNATGDFYAIKSSDGGMSWNEPKFFNPAGTASPKPLWAKQTGANELTAVWGDRDDRYIYALSMSAHLAWQDPRKLAEEPYRRIHRQIGDPERSSYWQGDAGDFGYPTFVNLGPDRSDAFLTFFDEGPRPNLWQMYLP